MAVLISINPKWCELIASGKKTIEVRKTKPKCEMPFRCYIYCTLDKKESFICRGDDDMPFDVGNGMVIGEFICDNIKEAHEECSFMYLGYSRAWSETDDCLSGAEIYDYGFPNEVIYGWHISDLKIYDKLKELSDFKKLNRKCHYSDLGLAIPDCNECTYCSVDRPPLSWMYVEDLE